VAIFAPLIAPHDPTQQYPRRLLVPPAGRKAAAAFLLGTDAVGRDMLSRLIYGARYSLFIGIVVVRALIGGIVSACSPAFPRLGRYVIMRGDGHHPGLPVAAAGAGAGGVLGPGLTNAMIAIAIVCSRISRA
jgi:dipeptide transport system permease protein